MEPLPSDAPSTGVPLRDNPVGLLLGFLVAIAARVPFDVEVFGEAHLDETPGALVVSNHRRDSDGPLVGGLLLRRRGLSVTGVAPWFVAREDLFRRGFLRGYLQGWPRPLRALLGHLSLGPVVRALQLRPMRRIPEHRLGELLTDVRRVLGDVPLARVLRPRTTARFARVLGADPARLTVSQALSAPDALLQADHAFRRMRHAAFRRMAPYERRVIARQLATFVHLLETGHTVLLEPEGRVSLDGGFRTPRAALHHLLSTPRHPPPVVPVALSYDDLRRGRPRVLVRFGSALVGLAGLPRRDADERVRRALLHLWAVNASHLMAHAATRTSLPDRRAAAERRLGRFLARAAVRCRDAGVLLDPLLLDPARRERRVHRALSPLRHADARLAYLDTELGALLASRPRLLAGLDR